MSHELERSDGIEILRTTKWGISVRLYNVLKRNNVHTLGELVDLDPEVAFGYRNLGFKCYDELRVLQSEITFPEWGRRAQRIALLETVQKALAGEDTVEWARTAQGSFLTLPYIMETLDSMIDDEKEAQRG